MPRKKDNGFNAENGSSDEEFNSDFGWMEESGENPEPEGEDTLGRTIVSSSRENREESWDKVMEGDLGPTIVSPEGRPVRRLGIGDTVVFSPRVLGEGFGFLVVRSGQRAGDIFKLNRPRNIIGRDRDAQVFIDDPHSSAKHASIRCEKLSGSEKAEFVLRDMDSENGTLVNGTRINSETILKDGDIIQIGKTDLVFKSV